MEEIFEKCDHITAMTFTLASLSALESSPITRCSGVL